VIELEEARRLVLAACRPLPAVEVGLAEALGCVTAAAVHARGPVPPFDNTAMDGYAVRSEDTAGASPPAPVRLTVSGTLAAGAAPDLEVRPGCAVRIMTGAPLPPGADAIVMVESTRPAADGAVVLVEAEARPGDHVRRAGDDLPAGAEVFGPGTTLGPGHMGVLASVGLERVEVVRRAKVGVLSTGDELVEGGGSLRPGQIRDSNRPSLLALARTSGCDTVDLGLVRDEPGRIRSALERGLGSCDAIVTSGGVSVGDFDYVKAVLDELTHGTMRWMQVAIRPAKPFAFGAVAGVPVFGLPGNPVSSLVSFELFARPALRRMMGHTRIDRPVVRAVADEDLRRQPDGKVHFVRVVGGPEADGRFHVRSSGGQASHMLRAMAVANALVVLPDGEGVAAGATVDAMLLSSD
jgi:molybdenum cofactor synthesis domain-containing protein